MKPQTWIRMKVMSFLASAARTHLAQVRGRLARSGQPTIHYFHQVDDPYSHLSVQKLDALKARYDVRFESHLVTAPAPEYQGDADRFTFWGLRDARSVAAYYGCDLPASTDEPEVSAISYAQNELAGLLDDESFAERAIDLGNALWRGDLKSAEANHATDALTEGNNLRAQLKHYLSGTFYFEGEWYWGVDRLVHLENRLIDMGLSSDPGSLIVPRPEAPAATGNADEITLEFFPSLRSPYTAVSYDRCIDVAKRWGVKLELRPVMPMMMRGVPAPRPKQIYIISDTRREADFYGAPLGNIVDPFGEPVKRAFSLLPYMSSIGKDVEYCSRYLKAAWVDGIDITSDKGLQIVVEQIGADWADAKHHLDSPEWQTVLEKNVSDMLDAGLWGVPSFRVTGGNSDEAFSCWGQDRLWRVEHEISNRIS